MKSSSSPMCLCRGSFAPGSKRPKIARRFVAGSLQKGFDRTPGIHSVQGISLSTIVCEGGAAPISLAGSDAAGDDREDGRAVLARDAVDTSVWPIADAACRDRAGLVAANKQNGRK